MPRDLTCLGNKESSGSFRLRNKTNIPVQYQELKPEKILQTPVLLLQRHEQPVQQITRIKQRAPR